MFLEIDVSCPDGQCALACIYAYKHRHVTVQVMARWNLVIADDTDRHVRSYLARTGGKKSDLSRFVDRAVSQLQTRSAG